MWIHLVHVCGWLILSTAAADEIDSNALLLEVNDEKIARLKNFTSCDHENGVDARCVEKSLCEDKAPPLDPSTTFTYREKSCILQQTCCPEDKIRTEPKKPIMGIENFKLCNHENGDDARCVKKSLCEDKAPPLDPSTTFTYREMVKGGCTYLQTCCPENKIRIKPRNPKVEKKLGCGYSNPGANVLRELSDKNGYADYGEFPWMIVLMKKGIPKEKFDTAYIGGGTLIDPSVVLTVAHKVDEISHTELICRAGEWDTKSEDETYKHQDREVKSVVIHSDFVKRHARNDVALIILKEPFDLDGAPHIGVACLERNLPSPGTECFSMGWGQDFLNEDKYASILKKLKLPLVAAASCQNLYRKSKLGPTYNLHRSLTCAGGEANVDTCMGDGGSSLVCPIADKSGLRFSVVGMVAYGLDNCGVEKIPGVYVKIPEVYDWVFKEMALQGYNGKLFVS